MSESAGQFTTAKYSSDFMPNENLNTSSISKIPASTPKLIPENSIRKTSVPKQLIKSSSSPSKSQPMKHYNSLTDKQKTEAYFDLYDQNLQLRTKQNELEGQIKKLTTQLVRLTKDIKPSSNIDFEMQNEELVKENKALKLKISALTVSKPKNFRPATAQQKKAPLPAKIIEKFSIDYENELKEREEIISLLRDQLEVTESELLRLQAKKPELPDLTEEFREKAYRLAEVENKFLSLEESMAAQKIYLEHVTQMLEDTKKTLKEERFKNCEMEFRLKAAEMAATGAQDLAHKLRESEYEKAQLEIRIKEIIEAYFALEASKKDNPINMPSAGIEKLPL